MYKHTSLAALSGLDDGSLILVTGRLRRHVLGTLLLQAGHSIPLIGEPISCAPRHGSAVDLWGQLLAGSHVQHVQPLEVHLEALLQSLLALLDRIERGAHALERAVLPHAIELMGLAHPAGQAHGNRRVRVTARRAWSGLGHGHGLPPGDALEAGNDRQPRQWEGPHTAREAPLQWVGLNTSGPEASTPG